MSTLYGPRKQRTRSHIIADQSVNHVERFIIDAGFTAQRIEKDYGYDLLIYTYDENGYIEPDFLPVQLKASETLITNATHFVFDLDIRDYNLWMMEQMPVILILFDASHRKGYWQPVQDFFKNDVARHPKKGAKSVRIHVPGKQVINRRAIARMRLLKQQVQRDTRVFNNEKK